MRGSFGLTRKEKFMEVDANRENLYKICKNDPKTLREISDIMQIHIYKIKSYVAELLKKNHIEKFSTGNAGNLHNVVRFISTENAYKARTSEELDLYLQSRKVKTKEVKKGMYDDLIASNPNLRKICLFDTKKTSDFLSGQKSKVNRSVSSAWGMYDTI